MNILTSLMNLLAQYLTEALSRPAQRLYTLLQCQPLSPSSPSTSEVRLTLSLLNKILTSEGTLGLWKSITYTTLRNYLYNPIQASFERSLTPIMFLYDPQEQFEYFFLSTVVRDALASSISTAIMHPFDCAVVKSTIAIGKENDQVLASGGVYSFLKTVYKASSFQGLYVGFYFRAAGLFYEKLLMYLMKLLYSDYMYPQVKESRLLAHAVDQSFLCVLWGLTYPVYTVSARLMREIGEKKQGEQSLWVMCKDILEVEGIAGFYKGGTVNLMLCLGLNLFGFLVKMSGGERNPKDEIREKMIKEWLAKKETERGEGISTKEDTTA